MKKITTLFIALLTVAFGMAQSSQRQVLPGSAKSGLKPVTNFQKRTPAIVHSGERAAVESFMIDYDYGDELYATSIGAAYQRFIWEVNRRYNNTDNFTLDYAAVVYDSLIVIDANDQATFRPINACTMTLDSFWIYFTHGNVTGNTDSVTITVFDANPLSITGTGANASLNTPALWDTLITTTTSLTAALNQLEILTLFPNYSFGQGQSFGIRVDFRGDTANKFNILAGYRDECSDACAAEPTSQGFNSIWYFNYTTTGGTNISGLNSVGLDCDMDGTVGTPGACEEFYLQNIAFIPFITANVEFGVAIQATQTSGCPGTNIDLVANGYGSDTTMTYAWSTSSGSLSNNTGNTATLTLGSGNAVVTVTVTDANNQTAVGTLTITSNGINVNINNPSPAIINCGQSLTITTTISGVIAGKNYVWSNGQSGTNLSSITVNTPGTYSVTVTNNAGCSATASITVQYTGNFTNTVNFQLPVTPFSNLVDGWCEDLVCNIDNTSARTSGWNFHWYYGDGNESLGEDGQNIYANPCDCTVRLVMDSAGCAFEAQKVLHVKSATSQWCVSSVEDLAFDASVSIVPNPSNGMVNISASEFGKGISIEVFNLIGAMVKSYNFTEVSNTFSQNFNFNELSAGSYLVRLRSGDKVAVKKMNIQR